MIVGSECSIMALPHCDGARVIPEKKMKEVAARTNAIVVAEINLGQMVREVERAVAGEVPVRFVGHAGGSVHNPEDILKAIMEVAR